ncbi:MAG: PDZ domain-containing protein, partial [Oscillospiraceae bacterium]|nr:PDZ domain-containing protein [Oscillospiraceae bacterium]
MFFDRISPTWKKVLSYVGVALAASALTFLICLSRPPQVNYTSTGVITNSQDKLNEIRKLIKERYIGDVDDDVLIEAAAKAMLEATGDQWSYYMDKQEYKYYTEDTNNAYEGIGVTVNQSKYNGGFLIEAVEENGGAALAGIKVGDVIIAVEGVSTDTMTIDEARNKIRGKKGTTVELTLNRNGQQMVLLVSRGPVAVFVAGGEMLEDNIG